MTPSCGVSVAHQFRRSLVVQLAVALLLFYQAAAAGREEEHEAQRIAAWIYVSQTTRPEDCQKEAVRYISNYWYSISKGIDEPVTVEVCIHMMTKAGKWFTWEEWKDFNIGRMSSKVAADGRDEGSRLFIELVKKLTPDQLKSEGMDNTILKLAASHFAMKGAMAGYQKLMDAAFEIIGPPLVHPEFKALMEAKSQIDFKTWIEELEVLSKEPSFPSEDEAIKFALDRHITRRLAEAKAARKKEQRNEASGLSGAGPSRAGPSRAGPSQDGAVKRAFNRFVKFFRK